MFIPKNLVYERVGQFMQQNEFLQNSISSEDKHQNAEKNFIIFNKEQDQDKISSRPELEVDWVDSSSMNIKIHYYSYSFESGNQKEDS